MLDSHMISRLLLPTRTPLQEITSSASKSQLTSAPQSQSLDHRNGQYGYDGPVLQPAYLVSRHEIRRRMISVIGAISFSLSLFSQYIEVELAPKCLMTRYIASYSLKCYKKLLPKPQSKLHRNAWRGDSSITYIEVVKDPHMYMYSSADQATTMSIKETEEQYPDMYQIIHFTKLPDASEQSSTISCTVRKCQSGTKRFIG